MDQMKLHEDLEKKVDEHSIQIQELHDEIDFKKWKIDSLIQKIDNLTQVVQEIQINQLKDDNNLNNRVTALESDTATSDELNDVIQDVTAMKSAQSTMKWAIGVALTGCGLVIAYLSLKGGML